MPSPAVSFAAALLIALVSTPLALRAALRFGTLDHPDDCLKRQAGPVPTLGGLAIYAAVALSLLPWLADPVAGAVLLGGAVLVVSGGLDDLGRLSLTAKLAAQSVAALIALFAFDLRIELTPLEGVPALAIALSFVWLVGLSNALNFLDVMDGLAAGTAAIAGVTLALIGIATGDATLAAVAAALAGACAGFLRYNRPPARIYMGDAGSLFLGFALGALALRGRYTEQSPWGAFAPVLILGVPVLEVAFVTLIRWRKGISPLRGSPDHIAYRLEAIGLSTPSVLAVLWTATALSAAAGFALQSADADTAAWIALAWAGAALCAAIPLARIPIEARKVS